MSDEELIRSTIAKSMAVGGQLMRNAVLQVLEQEFSQMVEGVDLDARKEIILERIREIALP
jgi:hypothetical protein